MAEPFLAEIRMVGFNFAPRGHAFCDGQLLPISQYQALFSLMGTTFGGDGRTTFGLPDMRGRTPIHPGASNVQGQKGGEEAHTLSATEMPAHTHAVRGSSDPGDSHFPHGNVPASDLPANSDFESSPLYKAPQAPLAAMAGGHVLNTGGGQAHDNMQPFLAIHFVIALQGLFPSRN